MWNGRLEVTDLGFRSLSEGLGTQGKHAILATALPVVERIRRSVEGPSWGVARYLRSVERLNLEATYRCDGPTALRRLPASTSLGFWREETALFLLRLSAAQLVKPVHLLALRLRDKSRSRVSDSPGLDGPVNHTLNSFEVFLNVVRYEG